MATPDISNQLANEMENGVIIHLDEKQELATSPTFTSTTATTLAPSVYSPRHGDFSFLYFSK